MSRSFDGSNDTAIGAFTDTYADPCSLALWVKITDHPVQIDMAMIVGNSNTSSNNSYQLRTSAADNKFLAGVQGPTGGFADANVIKIIDGVWAPWIGVFTNDTLRDVYLSDQTDTSVASISPADLLQHVRLGENMTGSQDFSGKLAEACFWNKALSAGEITNFLAGNSPLSIAGANLMGYWPMSADGGATEANLGVDSGCDLTITSATFDADHPTISGGGSSIAAKVRFYNMLRTGT